MVIPKSLLAPIFAGSTMAFQGVMTFYSPEGLTACGTQNSDTDFIVALSSATFTTDDCGRGVTISLNGKSVEATVADKCSGCGSDDIDVSTAVFSSLADTSVGRVEVEWDFA